MTAPSQVLKIRRPDDWHLHLRDGGMLKTVVPYTSEIYGRAIVMPNLAPPVTTVEAAVAYRQRILDAVPAGHDFTPLMTCYLTDSLDPNELERGFNEGVFTAAKLYPANATTNSSHGVTSVDAIMPVLERMEKIGMPLLVHGEVTHADIDIFDREARFIESVMEPLRQRLTALKVVFEHITTKDAADYVRNGNERLAATITPQHLMFNRNHMLVGACVHICIVYPSSNAIFTNRHCVNWSPAVLIAYSSVRILRRMHVIAKRVAAAARAASMPQPRWAVTLPSLKR